MKQVTEIQYQGRKALALENESLRAVVTVEGCNLAAVEHRASGVNPLWTPPWPSIEPSAYSRTSHPEYGDHDEAKVLASIQGHSICLDTYGGPSAEEAAAGIPIHGEAMFVPYQTSENAGKITLMGTLPLVQVRFSRSLSLAGKNAVKISESAENLTASDRPIAWCQHATIGPPFVEPGKTQFHSNVTQSKVIDADFGGVQVQGAEFQWPNCPKKGGGSIDLRTYPGDASSGGFTTHLVNPADRHGFWISWSPSQKIYFGYVWNREEFPWLCRWEENHLRSIAPWNRRTVTCGMEFSMSPTVESRRDMVTRGSLFGTPAYRWLPAKSRFDVTYAVFIGESNQLPRSVEWDGADSVKISD